MKNIAGRIVALNSSTLRVQENHQMEFTVGCFNLKRHSEGSAPVVVVKTLLSAAKVDHNNICNSARDLCFDSIRFACSRNESPKENVLRCKCSLSVSWKKQ